MKRLAPYNYEYIKEYADYLYATDKKQSAKRLLKGLLNNIEEDKKNEIKNKIKKYK